MEIDNQNKIQNLSLYNKAMGNRSKITQINDNIITNMNVSSNNYINNDSQDINNNMNYNNANLNYTYNITGTSYLDPKEVGQKRTLNEFKMLLNRIDEKLDMS